MGSLKKGLGQIFASTLAGGLSLMALDQIKKHDKAKTAAAEAKSAALSAAQQQAQAERDKANEERDEYRKRMFALEEQNKLLAGEQNTMTADPLQRW